MSETREDLEKVVGPVAKMSSSEIREDTKKKASRYKDVWLELAKNLYRIRLCQDYKKWNFDTFEDYVDKELGLEIRTVQVWISILNKFVFQAGVDEEKLKGSAWSKVAVTVPVVNKKNAVQWLEKAEKLSQKKLQHVVKNTLEGKKEGDGPEMDILTFHVTLDEKKTIMKALEAVAKIAQNQRPGHLLEMICLHFLGDHIDQRRDEYVRMIGRIEQLFHVKILGIDKENPAWKELFEKARDLIRGARVEM